MQEAQTERENLLEQLQRQLTQLTEELNNTPERVRTSSQEKEQIWQTFLKKADKAITYGLYTAIIIAVIFAWKLTNKFFSGLFGWAKKKNDENIEKIHKRIEMMAAELKVQELEQKAQSQITDQESEKKAVNVVVNLVPPTNNPSGENNHQPLTKTELKEPAPIAEKPPIKPSKKTPSERERDRKNAKRRARYQLKKMLASTTNDNKISPAKKLSQPKSARNKKSRENVNSNKK